ncbi:hypothetical protein BDQ12DRAFT_675361 [Crucibulum laeve]|uniref:Zn-dependent exopeptidase n=1 Tax=Crucibulum laeve TaxID=68775 RepID=A0A5C3MIA7_9AGAR|nr:hypothetical protein BDQ12DRAFT_675361 [Crucibulum laeve]
MIIMDQEKHALTSAYASPETVLPVAADSEKALLNSIQRQRRRTRRFAHFAAISALLLLLGYKIFTSRVSLFRPPGHGLYHPGPPGRGHRHPHRPLTIEEREKLYLSIPTVESALAASRAYATHPHLAGSPEDYEDAKTILELFQTEFGIKAPSTTPIFSAGTPQSRNATLLLTTADAPNKPTAWIDTYYPVLNTPLDRSVEILGDNNKSIWTADLVEDGDPRDEDAHKYKNSVPTWHGLSRDGDVTGQLVYANYGSKEDYDSLVAHGVNLTGKIVITRYGGIFRGLKIKGAQELGAAGVLIYSDPRDDGFVTVSNGYTPYPAGPARNPTSVQRGSVQYLSSYPGDPTTPGYPAYEDADREEGSNIPTIPSLPISWQNAERLLEEIGEIYQPQVDASGKRRLSGKASETNIRLVNHVDTKVTPIWNAMASIPGHIRNEVVVIGCHRDAWVLGAADPTSGTVSLHEIIRGFGGLLKRGWKPLRTVVFASWDAEEYGLVGSTEWGEDFPSWISDHVVAYLNVDVSVAGSRWTSSASPSLAHIIKATALDIPHPTSPGKTLWDAREDEGPFKGSDDDVMFANMTIDAEYFEAYKKEKKEIHASKTGITPLGSGSDYTVFLQRLGVASTDQGFGFTASDAVYHYHSIYDSQHWQEIYADPGFHRHVAVAKHLGLLGLRLIDSIVLPLNTTQYALELDDYLDRVENLIPELSLGKDTPNFSSLRKSISKLQSASFDLDKEKAEAEEEFKKLLKWIPGAPRRRGECRRRNTVRRRAADWIKSVFGVPRPTDEDFHRLAVLHGRSDAWEDYLEFSIDSESDFLSAYEQFEAGNRPPHHLPFPIRKFIKAAKRVSKANQKLITFERGFISEGGIKDREWYKHLGVAPGKWLGYGATTFPGLTEALSIEKNVTLAMHEANRLEDLLKSLTKNVQP